MNFSNINKAFKEQWNFIPITDDTDKGQLAELLNKTIQELKAKDAIDFNIYFTAFVEDIESVFPDNPWYNSVGLDIRNDLFNTQNPEITAEHILDSIIDASAYRNSELTEAANPDNAAINKVIYEVASGKSRAIKKLEKMSESWSDKYAGTTAVFKVKPGFDTAENWGVSEADMNEIFSHNNDKVTIQSLCVEGIPTNFKNSFWNIRFDDGLVLDGVSGYNLYQ